MIGIIKGTSIAKNKDSDIKRVLLQVEFADLGENISDVKTIELMSQAGENINPGVDCRVMIVEDSESYKLAIAVSDDIEPDAAAGEKEYYSTDSPVTVKKAKIKLNSASEVVLNDGTDYAVQFAALKTEFNKLKDDYDDLVTKWNTFATAYVPGSPTVQGTPPTALTGSLNTSNIDNTKVEKVRLP